jgi:TatD DNase family protein
MFIDSHCHLDRIDLTPYHGDFAAFVADAQHQQLDHMLCISIDLQAFPAMQALVEPYDCISLSVGVHPNETSQAEPSADALLQLAAHPKVVAIGETGLDYFRSEGDLDWQRQRFKTHIQVAKQLNKPLIIHTRDAGHDALTLLEQEGADAVGGVIHCFTEDWAYAEKAMALNFYISFSGIVTFNNADAIKDFATRLPADRFLIETDSPYLAPVPYRGKPNYPTYVRKVAEQLAGLRGESLETIAAQSSANYQRLFGPLAH